MLQKLVSQYIVTRHLCFSHDVNETFAFKIHQQICHITTTIHLHADAQMTIRGRANE